MRGCRPESSRTDRLIWWPPELNPEVHPDYWIHSATWSAFGDVTGEGLDLDPREASPFASVVIVIPDADQTPEQLVGLTEGVSPESQVARRLAANGYHVIVPALIDRTVAARNGRAKLTNREFLYRSAFELGRHLIGYEVQKVLGLIDALKAKRLRDGQKIVVFGYGEGGMIALYAAALDPRIEAVCVSGYFGDRNEVWQAAGRPQCIRPARAVRRCRGRQFDRARVCWWLKRRRDLSSSSRREPAAHPGG